MSIELLTPGSVRRTTAAPVRTRVLSLDVGGHTRFLELRAELVRLGRGRSADLCFDDGTVSRRHALVLTRPDGSVEVIDEQSLSGTFVNGEPVERRTLRDGDEIRIGRTTLRFRELP